MLSQKTDVIESQSLERIKMSGGRITPIVLVILEILGTSEKAFPLPHFQFLLKNRIGYSGSLSTIYRIVNRLTAIGVLSSLKRQDGEIVYFSCKQTSHHHHHFLCTDCARVLDANICMEKTYHDFLKQTLGAHMTSHVLQFEGLCKDCISKLAKA